MKLSTRSTYGLRALSYLAKRHPDNVSLGDIAKHEKISSKYLESIFATLRRSGLVTSSKGAGGGYQLAEDPGKISVWQAVSALEREMPEGHCIGSQGKSFCQPGCCQVGNILMEVQKSIQKKLKQYSLQDLVAKK